MATVGVALRIGEKDRAEWTELAKAQGLNLQQWIRQQCTRAASLTAVSSVVDLKEFETHEVVKDDLKVLEKPFPPKRKKTSSVCSECVRKNGGKPRRGCPNGCWERFTKSIVEEE